MKLRKILKYYTKKHKLKIDLEVVDFYSLSGFYIDSEHNKNCGNILISKKHIKNIDFKNRIITKKLQDKIIFTLLHEIGHSLQYKKSKGYDDFTHTYNIQARLEHSERPFEIEADIFARQELKKWIKK